MVAASLHRVGILENLPGILRLSGLNPVEVLASAGLGPNALDDADGVITFPAKERLLHLTAEATKCPHIGLEISSGMQTKSLGLIGDLMRNAPTIGDALRDFANHHHRLSNGTVAYLLEEKHGAYFGFASLQSERQGHNVICDCLVMASLQLVRELARPEGVMVSEVLLSRRKPKDMGPYQRVFSTRFRFDAEQTALLLPRALLDRPVFGADPGQRNRMRERVALLWYAGESDIVMKLRRALRVGMLRGPISAVQICGELQIAKRTLHRRLAAVGLHYQQVLDETRSSFARQLLAHTRLSASEVGIIVGYPDPSVFSRAFVRWTGRPPAEWRRVNARNPIAAPAASGGHVINSRP